MLWTYLPKVISFINKPVQYAFAGAIVVIGVFYLGYTSGKDNVQGKWDKEKLIVQKQIEDLRAKQLDLDQRSAAQLYQARLEYEKKLSAITSDYAKRLHEHSSRISYYREQAQASVNDRLRLAELTARFDQQLVEGIRVVEDLQGIIKLRDTQIKELQGQLKNGN